MTPKKAEVKQSESKPVVSQPTTPAPATAKAEPPPSKQDQTVTKLVDAWKARGVDVGKLEKKPDGKFLLLQLPGFPVVRVGSSGGIDLPTIKSYAKAFDAAVHGDELLAKQAAREAKKQAASVPATKPTAAPAASEKKAETPTARKQRQSAEVERHIEARA